MGERGTIKDELHAVRQKQSKTSPRFIPPAPGDHFNFVCTGCVATLLDNWPIRRLKLATDKQKQTHCQTMNQN